MISFMEIYNECAYDLLDKKHLELPLENWSKVYIFIILYKLKITL